MQYGMYKTIPSGVEEDTITATFQTLIKRLLELYKE